MRLVKPSYKILTGMTSAQLIEYAGRVCYKSEAKGDPDAHEQMQEVMVPLKDEMTKLWS